MLWERQVDVQPESPFCCQQWYSLFLYRASLGVASRTPSLQLFLSFLPLWTSSYSPPAFNSKLPSLRKHLFDELSSVTLIRYPEQWVELERTRRGREGRSVLPANVQGIFHVTDCSSVCSRRPAVCKGPWTRCTSRQSFSWVDLAHKTFYELLSTRDLANTSLSF